MWQIQYISVAEQCQRTAFCVNSTLRVKEMLCCNDRDTTRSDQLAVMSQIAEFLLLIMIGSTRVE